MTDQPLSVNEVLRHLKHDIVNELQLIQMHLTLDDVEEAKKVVADVSAKCNQFFQVNGLKSENLMEWLHTCKWLFSSIQFTIESDISSASLNEWDLPIRNYLNRALQHIQDSISPFVDQYCHIYIESTEVNLEIIVELTGQWESNLFSTPIQSTDLNVIHDHYSDTLWRFRVIGSKEGK